MPLDLAPGAAYQFDWSHEIVLINGTTVDAEGFIWTARVAGGSCLTRTGAEPANSQSGCTDTTGIARMEG